jgi:phosphomannomutase
MHLEYFGTDGIRGDANTGPMTTTRALRVGKATGQYFCDMGRTRA